MLNQLDEKRLAYSVKRPVKVRSFSGAMVHDMYNYITPLLKKEPSIILLHIGTNDATRKSSEVILDDIMKLKVLIEEQLPT